MKKATSSLLEVNKLKFPQHPDLAEFLMKTGTTHIIEASSFSKKWGICISINSPDIFLREKWKGDTEIGRSLWISHNICYELNDLLCFQCVYMFK